MIEIISHRGIWTKEEERNSLKSFDLSLKKGFGIETDIRDNKGGLIISHDVPFLSDNLITIDDFLTLYSSSKTNLMLALNIKADGLSHMLKEKLDHYGVSNYFVFDMSIPDSLSYSNESMIFYTRQSELEKKPALYEDSFGVWLDSFYSDWIDTDTIAFHQNNNKKICIVSPELHGRPHEQAWSKYKGLNLSNPELCFFLCTDFPIEARSYFEY